MIRYELRHVLNQRLTGIYHILENLLFKLGHYTTWYTAQHEGDYQTFIPTVSAAQLFS